MRGGVDYGAAECRRNDVSECYVSRGGRFRASLRLMRRLAATFDMVVLDPPAFAKSRGQVEGAARGYKDINLRALRLLGPGGILVTCSCSHHMSEAMLLEILAEAALDAAGRCACWSGERRRRIIRFC